ncbi:MAG: SDR family oxidoreductase [Planctomycetota bacterium]
MDLFRQKIIAVTGASSGIGLETALAFAREGAVLCVGARRRDLLNDVAARCRETSRDQALPFTLDVTNQQSCKDFIKEIIENYKRLDVLVINAGITMDALSYEVDPSILRELMEVNYFGAIQSVLPAIPYLIESKGTIVVISSITGKRPVPTRSGYCASKYALHGFFESMRLELKSKGVHILMVCPGFTDTEMQNNRRGKDGTPVPNKIPRKYTMSASAVATKIVQATRRRKKEIILSAVGKTIVFLTRWCPPLADYLVCKNMK